MNRMTGEEEYEYRLPDGTLGQKIRAEFDTGESADVPIRKYKARWIIYDYQSR